MNLFCFVNLLSLSQSQCTEPASRIVVCKNSNKNNIDNNSKKYRVLAAAEVQEWGGERNGIRRDVSLARFFSACVSIFIYSHLRFFLRRFFVWFFVVAAAAVGVAAVVVVAAAILRSCGYALCRCSCICCCCRKCVAICGEHQLHK